MLEFKTRSSCKFNVALHFLPLTKNSHYQKCFFYYLTQGLEYDSGEGFSTFLHGKSCSGKETTLTLGAHLQSPKSSFPFLPCLSWV